MHVHMYNTVIILGLMLVPANNGVTLSHGEQFPIEMEDLLYPVDGRTFNKITGCALAVEPA